MNGIQDYISQLSAKQTSTALSALVYTIVILVTAFIVGENKIDRVITILLFTLGATLGWLVAIIISPYNVSEKDRFLVVGQTISAFVSGYLLSKVDKPVQAYIDLITKRIQDSETDFNLSQLSKVRLIGMVISFVLSTITVYVYRATEYDKITTAVTAPVSTTATAPGSISNTAPQSTTPATTIN